MAKKRINISSKLVYIILSVSVLTYVITVGYIITKYKKGYYKNAIELADSYSRTYSNSVSKTLNKDMNITKTMSEALSGFQNIEQGKRVPVYKDILKRIAEQNDQFVSVWVSWELQHFDTAWTNSYGRARLTYFRENGELFFKQDTLNVDGDNKEGIYYKLKLSKDFAVTEPYWFSYTNNDANKVLETSVCAPILTKNTEFAGLTGVDILLDRFQNITKKIKPLKKGFTFLVSNDATYIGHPSVGNLGKQIKDVNPQIVNNHQITTRIKNGESFSFVDNSYLGEESYFSFNPIFIGKTKTPWALCTVVPTNIINKRANSNFILSIFIGLIGFIILALVVILLGKYVSRIFLSIVEVLRKLSKGNINFKNETFYNYNDEIGDILEITNELQNGLKKTAIFSKEIGEGNYDAEFNTLGENDVLGNALLKMRENLDTAKKLEEDRKIEEGKRTWTTTGLAKFADLLQNTSSDIKEFTFEILSEIIKYVGANQGGIFIINAENESQKHIELVASYAYDRKKYKQKRIDWGEGLVGRCILEKKRIYLTEVPVNYIDITSGLGGMPPRVLLLVPIVLNDTIYGVIELASFSKIEDYKIDFLEKIGEGLSSTLSNIKVAAKTNKLLEQTKEQSELMNAQEEEMRQNMEELLSIQEEIEIGNSEDKNFVEAINSTSMIIEYDISGNIIKANDVLLSFMNIGLADLCENNYLSGIEEGTKTYEELVSDWSKIIEGESVQRITEYTIEGADYKFHETYIPITDDMEDTEKVIKLVVNLVGV